MVSKSVTRVGAVAVLVGLSVAGPNAAASAESPEADSNATSVEAPADQQRTTRPQRSTRAAAPASADAGASTEGFRVAVPRARTATGRASADLEVTESPTSTAWRTPTVPVPESSERAEFRLGPATATDNPGGLRQARTSGPDLDASGGLTASTVARIPAAAAASPATFSSAENALRPTRLAASAASSAPMASASAQSSSCSACWGVRAPTLGQAVSTAVNHLFNSTFDWLAALPGGPIDDLITGALALVRRTLFFVPEGVTASQTTNGLVVTVNTGSTAYFRQDGTSVQVSGDPLFWGAEHFTLSADDTVAVSNPGNAGCAGFVFTSGTAHGDLTTTSIDSMRFEGDSAFTGRVDSALLGAPLSLRDAVRGLSGVAIDASVVLGNNVSVDAGMGDALFEGAVDGTKTGKQSLTVTALGGTVFVAPVGGVTPLASLLTQGIAPLNVAQNSDSTTIPLRFLPEFFGPPPTSPTASPGGVKYGIDVAIGDNPSQVYEFDTGGTAFFAGYNQAFWTNVPLTTTPANEVYNSGIYYDGVVANTVVTLGQGKQTVSTAQPIGIGAILSGGNATPPATTLDFTNPLVPPVEGQFFGDFGASLAVNNGLANPLLQLPGNLGTGFLVQLGPIGVPPQLTVGVTDELREQFPYAVPVIESPAGGTYPTSGYPVLDQFGFAPAYSVTRNGQTENLGTQPPLNITCATSKPCLPTLIDSGAPTAGIRLGQDSVPYFATPNGEQLLPGTTFSAVFPTTQGRPALTWEFVAGENSSVNEVRYQQTQKPSNPENVNVGLTLYNYYDVMFDVVEKTIWLRPTGAQSTVQLNSVTTTGDQTYRQNVQLDGTYTTTKGGSFSVAGITVLDGDTVIATGDGDVRFSGTVDSATAGTPSSLTVNTTGATGFVREVGGQAELASLAVNGGGDTRTAAVRTEQDQTYSGDVVLNGLYSVTDGTFSAAQSATLNGPVAVFGGDIDFGGTIDAQPGKGFQLNLTPGDGNTATLSGTVGSVNPLGGLAVYAVADGSATVSAPASITLRGDLGFAAERGIDIGDGVSASFTGGGLIQSFPGAGIVMGASKDSVIQGLVINSNGKDGVQVTGAKGLRITGNNISGNGSDGIHLEDSTDADVDGNTLSANTSAGIMVKAGQGNAILSNSIFGNAGKGIELSDGGNDSQSAPVIDSASLTAGNSQLVLQGKVIPDQGYTGPFEVQVFYTPASTTIADVQGQQLIYTATTTTTDAKPTSFTFTIPVSSSVESGGFITATATPTIKPTNTSEFSNVGTIQAAPNPL
jgi:parallel beta-helix repeat protein